MSRRFFRHGELPLVLLALVAERPRHGYEIMHELTRLFGPRYRASPGSVYPAIDALQTEGLIAGRAQGEKTVYGVTDVGEKALDDRAEMLAAIELRVGVRLRAADSLESLLARFKARLMPLSGRIDPAAAAAVLEDAAGEIERLHQPKSTRSPKKRSKNAR